jgi:hypothetical protein
LVEEEGGRVATILPKVTAAKLTGVGRNRQATAAAI